jgi:hypothetical protein
VKNKNVNKLGIVFVIIASLITIVDCILWIIGIKILPENVIGDMLYMLTIVYALSKIKKKKQKST